MELEHEQQRCAVGYPTIAKDVDIDLVRNDGRWPATQNRWLQSVAFNLKIGHRPNFWPTLSKLRWNQEMWFADDYPIEHGHFGASHGIPQFWAAWDLPGKPAIQPKSGGNHLCCAGTPGARKNSAEKTSVFVSLWAAPIRRSCWGCPNIA